MLTINIHDAKTQLSRLVEKAAQGEAFIIAKAGKPMVKVIPLSRKEKGTINRLSFMAGEFSVPDDFDQMSDDGIAGMFEGKAACTCRSTRTCCCGSPVSWSADTANWLSPASTPSQ